MFSSTGAAKLVICITSLFIIYGKAQIFRVFYDCYLIHSASWNKGPAISLSCRDLMEDSRTFPQAYSTNRRSYWETCLSKVIWEPLRPQTLPSSFLNFSFTPISNPHQDLNMSPSKYLLIVHFCHSHGHHPHPRPHPPSPGLEQGCPNWVLVSIRPSPSPPSSLPFHTSARAAFQHADLTSRSS